MPCKPPKQAQYSRSKTSHRVNKLGEAGASGGASGGEGSGEYSGTARTTGGPPETGAEGVADAKRRACHAACAALRAAGPCLQRVAPTLQTRRFRAHRQKLYAGPRHEYDIIVCHMNVIRYFVLRALQLPPEAWLRLGGFNGSIAHLTIRPCGRCNGRCNSVTVAHLTMRPSGRQPIANHLHM